MKNKVFLAILIITGFSFYGNAQDFDQEKLDNYFQLLEKNDRFQGSIAVAKDGNLKYSKSIGYADIKSGKKATENTKFRIGSISKTFTTVLILQAIERNKLLLNQTIDIYFPTIQNAEKITIKHLLNHRSGIHNFTDDQEYSDWNTKEKTKDEMIEIISLSGSDFAPGTKADYSNSNFVLLTYILEKIYKISYKEILNQDIVEPLGLKTTYYGDEIAIDNNESYSYFYNNNWTLAPETHHSIPLGAGGIVSTPSDLIMFADNLFNGNLLGKESFELMKTIEDGYGIGLFRIPFYDHTGYGHTGGIDGFSSVLAYFPKEKVCFALTSNGTRLNNNDITITVLSAIFNKPFNLPEFSNYRVNPKDFALYLGSYSSEQIPLTITIFVENDILYAQGSGQSPFALEAIDKNKFKYDQAGIEIEFVPSKKVMLLRQGGAEYKFNRG